MRLPAGQIALSATDLANHLACRHLSWLELSRLHGHISPPRWSDPSLQTLEQRGRQHELAYLDELRVSGREVVTVPESDTRERAVERTRAAMGRGTDVIYQAVLGEGRWGGRSDFLVRVEGPSDLGDWSYEVHDTKLARETRGGALLQLCLYSELVGGIQGRLPVHTHVVRPGRGARFEIESHRLEDFLAYYRFVKTGMERWMAEATPGDDDHASGVYPEPVPHCDVCRWWQRCDRRRRDDDHPSLVAGITRLQRRELLEWSVTTLEQLAQLPIPLARRPRRGSRAALERTREQARLQAEGRRRGVDLHELLPLEPRRGLAHLPAPSPGDVFLDFEGDPFAGEAGLEYLTGWVTLDDQGDGRYASVWALDPAAEKASFERLMDLLTRRLEQHPDLHVYHFSPYEPSAIKRLAGRHATRGSELDRLLRGERFVDLLRVVRQSLRASVESYSIKEMERFYRFDRSVDLRDAAAARRAVEIGIELGEAAALDARARATVEKYNRDDCFSTLALRDWLEQLRAERIAAGDVIERPAQPEEEAKPERRELDERIDAVAADLTSGLPDDPSLMSANERARWLLAQLLGFHSREEKADWWEYFRLRELPDEELIEESRAIANLELIEVLGGKKRLHRYRFPKQETSIRAGKEVQSRTGRFGTVEAIDLSAHEVTIRRNKSDEATSVFSATVITTQGMTESLLRIGTWVARHGIDAPGEHRAARDLLMRLPPRLAGAEAEPGSNQMSLLAELSKDGRGLRRPGENVVDAASRLALALDEGVLAIQGPPGTGKTFTGARAIVDLVRAGRKVGVSAVSHAVIRNLLRAVHEADPDIRCGRKRAQDEDPDLDADSVEDNESALKAISSGEVDVFGGTAHMWAREEFAHIVDVLVIDEAGQMSLAMTLSASPAAERLILLGDPQQLDQPIQAAHPEGADVSALRHLLGSAKTLTPDRGLFLDETWRLAPEIGSFTSEVFYENRLESRPGLERQALTGDTPFAGSGLWFVPLTHDGNQSASAEEVEAIAVLTEGLLRSGVAFRDSLGADSPLTWDDILIVAPYNAQVSDLQVRLPLARVGTVDRFQGQEAAVVVYSMTTSSPEDAPRGMDFFFSPHRFNVATSRARAACILLGSPSLFEPECRTPKHMRLANAFCRYRERSREVLPAAFNCGG